MTYVWKRSRKRTEKVRRLAKVTGLPFALLRKLRLEDAAKGITIPVLDERKQLTGSSRLCRDLQMPRQTNWQGKAKLYGLWNLPAAREASQLCLVECETDVWVLYHYGIPALGVFGNAMIKQLHLQHLDGIKLICPVRGPDKSNDQFVEGVVNHLTLIGYRGEVRIIDPQATCGVRDLSELHKLSSRGFRRQWKHAMQTTRPCTKQLHLLDQRSVQGILWDEGSGSNAV